MSPVPPGVPRKIPPVPLERGRARGILAGLLVFGLGFVVAAAAVLVGAGQPLYLSAVGVGFLGVAVVAFFVSRGTVPLPDAPIWSPTGLRVLSRALDLPATGVMAVVYTLIGLGIVGNVVIPVFFG